MSSLVVALGNPGKKYEGTRHNIAWQLVDSLSFSSDLIWKEKFNGIYSEKNIGGEKVYFLKPTTYMNLSGQSVQKLVQFFKIELGNIIVIHDELDFDFGRIAFKKGGGLAGHNGLKSINECLGSKDFFRLRMGIGRPPRGSVSNWVLSNFSSDEKIDIDKYLSKTGDALEDFFTKGFQHACQEYNKESIIN